MLAPEEKLKLVPKPYLAATARLATGADMPRDFLERCLADLAAVEPKIGAFVHLNLEGARAAADQSTTRWRAGRPHSTIDGMPLGIKDIIETADMPTENGSPLFVVWRSERDAASAAAPRQGRASRAALPSWNPRDGVPLHRARSRQWPMHWLGSNPRASKSRRLSRTARLPR